MKIQNLVISVFALAALMAPLFASAASSAAAKSKFEAMFNAKSDELPFELKMRVSEKKAGKDVERELSSTIAGERTRLLDLVTNLDFCAVALVEGCKKQAQEVAKALEKTNPEFKAVRLEADMMNGYVMGCGLYYQSPSGEQGYEIGSGKNIIDGSCDRAPNGVDAVLSKNYFGELEKVKSFVLSSLQQKVKFDATAPKRRKTLDSLVTAPPAAVKPAN